MKILMIILYSRNTLKQGEKSFFYLLILSSTPKQESLLTPLNQVDFLGTPSGHISYQGKTICVCKHWQKFELDLLT